MNPQTFRAPNTQAALEQIQRELGAEAMIVSVRQVPSGPAWQVWKPTEVEVMAVPAEDSSARKPSPLPVTPPGRKRPPAHREDIEELLSQLTARIGQNAQSGKMLRPQTIPERKREPVPEETPIPLKPAPRTAQSTPPRVSGAPAAATPPAAPVLLPAALKTIRARLSAQGVDDSLAVKVIETCHNSLNRNALEDASRVRLHIQRQLEAELRVRQPSTDRLVCVVGTSGAGKTSICASLAAQRRQQGQKVAWICADTVRAGAIALARAYTETLGIPLRLAYTPEELAAAATEVDADWVVVDTPSVNPRREAEIVELGAFITALPRRATYLAAPATARESDLSDAAAAFGPFHLTGLVITKLDETGSFGSAFNFTWRSRLPLVYFTAGRRIPDDLQPAQSSRLVDLLLSKNG